MSETEFETPPIEAPLEDIGYEPNVDASDDLSEIGNAFDAMEARFDSREDAMMERVAQLLHGSRVPALDAEQQANLHATAAPILAAQGVPETMLDETIRVADAMFGEVGRQAGLTPDQLVALPDVAVETFRLATEVVAQELALNNADTRAHSMLDRFEQELGPFDRAAARVRADELLPEFVQEYEPHMAAGLALYKAAVEGAQRQMGTKPSPNDEMAAMRRWTITRDALAKTAPGQRPPAAAVSADPPKDEMEAMRRYMVRAGRAA